MIDQLHLPFKCHASSMKRSTLFQFCQLWAVNLSIIERERKIGGKIHRFLEDTRKQSIIEIWCVVVNSWQGLEISTCWLVGDNQNNHQTSINEEGSYAMDKQEATSAQITRDKPYESDPNIAFNISQCLLMMRKNYGYSTVNTCKSVCCNYFLYIFYLSNCS